MTTKKELQEQIDRLTERIEKLEEQPDTVMVPAGLHEVKVVDAEFKISGGSGRPYWRITVKVKGYKQLVLGHYTPVDPFRRLEAICSEFGIRTVRDAIWLEQAGPEQLIGQEGWARVEHDTYNGGTYARVNTLRKEHP